MKPRKGAAARSVVDAACDLLEACGHPDGARLRAALAACDEALPPLLDHAKDADPIAALLETLAARRRKRLPRPR